MIWRSFRGLSLSLRFNRSCLAQQYSSKIAATSRTIAQILHAQPTPNSIISVLGTVRTVRNQKRISFAAIGDGSTTQSLQVVLEPVQAEGYDISQLSSLLLNLSCL